MELGARRPAKEDMEDIEDLEDTYYEGHAKIRFLMQCRVSPPEPESLGNGSILLQNRPFSNEHPGCPRPLLEPYPPSTDRTGRVSAPRVPTSRSPTTTNAGPAPWTPAD